MNERALMLGENESMLGILSEPGTSPDSERPLFVVLNSGIVHRIGPHRNAVRLTRSLAKAGFRTLRLDLSGIGDSAARRDALQFDQAALADIREVLDHLESSFGVENVVLIGLCSGADNAFQAAIREPRVIGAVMMDGYAYRTKRFWIRFAGKRVTKLKYWVSLKDIAVGKAKQRIRRVFDRGDNGAANAAGGAATPEWVRGFPPRDEVADKMQKLVDRGVHLYWLYTVGMTRYYNYENQFTDSFKDVDFKDRLTLGFFSESDHTFTERRSQQMLVDSVTSWAKRTFRPEG